MVEWQRDVSDPNEFLTALKVDLYPKSLHFTPKGKVVVLHAKPRPSTLPTRFTEVATLAWEPK